MGYAKVTPLAPSDEVLRLQSQAAALSADKVKAKYWAWEHHEILKFISTDPAAVTVDLKDRMVTLLAREDLPPSGIFYNILCIIHAIYQTVFGVVTSSVLTNAFKNKPQPSAVPAAPERAKDTPKPNEDLAASYKAFLDSAGREVRKAYATLASSNPQALYELLQSKERIATERHSEANERELRDLRVKDISELRKQIEPLIAERIRLNEEITQLTARDEALKGEEGEIDLQVDAAQRSVEHHLSAAKTARDHLEAQKIALVKKAAKLPTEKKKERDAINAELERLSDPEAEENRHIAALEQALARAVERARAIRTASKDKRAPISEQRGEIARTLGQRRAQLAQVEERGRAKDEELREKMESQDRFEKNLFYMDVPRFFLFGADGRVIGLNQSRLAVVRNYFKIEADRAVEDAVKKWTPELGAELRALQKQASDLRTEGIELAKPTPGVDIRKRQEQQELIAANERAVKAIEEKIKALGLGE